MQLVLLSLAATGEDKQRHNPLPTLQKPRVIEYQEVT